MNRLNDTDLREALRRREARRPETEVPEDFCANVMHAIEQRPRRTRRVVLMALAAAASVALLVVMTHRSADAVSQPDSPTSQPSPAVTSHVTSVHSPCTNGTQPVYKKYTGCVRTVHRPCTKSKTPQTAATTPADSLDYYIAKLERGLEQVRESCYEAHIERLIRADAQLQKIVSTLMIKELMADTVSTASRLTTEYIEP